MVRRVVDRTRARFNVSVAEVADQDRHDTALLGVTFASNSASHVDSVLDKVLAFMAGSHLEAEISPEEREVFPW